MSLQTSYVSGDTDKPLLGMTIGELFDDFVKKYPDNTALIVTHQNVNWSYRTFSKRVVEVARALMAIGVEKGIENTVEYYKKQGVLK